MGNKLAKVHPMEKSKEVQLLPSDAWDRKMKPIKKSGAYLAETLRAQGHPFKVMIFALREARSDEPLMLSGVTLPLDWKIETRWKMFESARDLMTNAYIIDALDPGLSAILSSVIEGKGLYEHGIGEFFTLYGAFEQRHGTTGPQTGKKMEEFVKGDQRYLKQDLSHRTKPYYPLPYVVRNILAHIGGNPNTLDIGELRAAITLLKSWVE